MLIQFFKSSFITQYIALILIATALWVPAFLSYSPIIDEGNLTTPLYHFIVRFLPHNSWIAPLTSLLIVIVTSIILNNIFIFHELIPKNSLLPAFIFVLFMSSSPSILTLYPVILVLLPLIFFLHQAYQVYEQYENPNEALSLGLLAGISSMVYFPAILFIVYAWFVFLLYRILNWRQWAIALLGFVLPYLYLVVFYFWTDQLVKVIEDYTTYFSQLLQPVIALDFFQISIWVIFILLMLLPATVRIISTLSSQNINFRRKMSVTIWLAIFGVMTFALQNDVVSNTVIYIPASGIVALHFHAFKKSAWNEIVLLAFMVLIGIHNYLSI